MEVGRVIHGQEEWWKMAGEGQGFFGYINGRVGIVIHGQGEWWKMAG